MDEIAKRLKETSDACLGCYETWSKNKKDSDAISSLQDSVHELRKVASRLEIELAVNERGDGAQKPIPIPPHRDANRRSQSNAIDDDMGNYNDAGEGSRSGGPKGGGQRRRRPPSKKSAGN